MRRSLDDSIVMATLDKETAQSCGYALPRGNKPITGPSVHLAKIIVSNWGNMRTEAKVVQITDTQVVSRGTAWDLEKTWQVLLRFVALSLTKRETVSKRHDNRNRQCRKRNSLSKRRIFGYSKSITDKVYQAAQSFITGDLSDEDKLKKTRAKWIAFFKTSMVLPRKR